MDIIGTDGVEYDRLVRIVDDLEVILGTIEAIGGGTKSRIADDLPDTLAVDFDAENIVPVLRVLEAYDLVRLDGNTWRPGPALEPPSESAD